MKKKFLVNKNSPDEFWFGNGYFTVDSGKDTLITENESLARLAARLLNAHFKKLANKKADK